MPVYCIDAGAQDVIQVELVFYAGNWFETKPAIASATNSLLKAGTTNKTAFELNEAFENLGAYCNCACYNETAVINVSSLTKHINTLLPLLKEMLTDASFLEEELNTFKQNCLQKLSVNLKKSDFVANRLMDNYMYGANHPYGVFTNAKDIQALDVSTIKAFYNKYYVHGNCAIFVSGKLPENIIQILDESIGKLSLNKPSFEILFKPITPALEKKFHVVNDPNGVQGSIRIARDFPNRHHPDFIPVMVLNTVLGGFFGSRLMSNIREEKGYTYGIHSYIQNHVQKSIWLISTEAGVDVCKPTIEEVYKEMEILQTTLMDEDELLLVKNFLIGTILGDLDGPFQIMSRWKNLILNNLDDTFFYKTIETIKNINAEELQILAKKYLTPSDFYELVVV